MKSLQNYYTDTNFWLELSEQELNLTNLMIKNPMLTSEETFNQTVELFEKQIDHYFVNELKPSNGTFDFLNSILSSLLDFSSYRCK